MNKFRRLILLSAGYIGFIFFLTHTNPNNLPVLLLIIPFIVLFVLLYMTAHTFMALIMKPGRLKSSFSVHVLALILAGLPTLLLVLQSINQLAWRDVMLLLAFAVFAFLYISRFSARNSR